MDRPCSGVNVDGTRCSGRARPGTEWCAWHSPDLQERIAAGRAKGGRGKSSRERLRKRYAADCLSMREVQGLLSRLLRDLVDGEGDGEPAVSPSIATAAASLGRSIAAVAQVGDVEERLAALERAAGVEPRRTA